jgi:cytochrome P450
MTGTTKPPPGPPQRWFRGNLPEFRQDRLGFLTRCAREYGDVFQLRLGPRRITVFCHPDHIEQVLVTANQNFRKHFALRINPVVLGKGLLTSEGEFWLRQRRLSQPAFLKQRITRYSDIMVRCAEQSLADWQPGRPCDILKEMMKLTLAIIAKTLFGADIGGQAGDVGEALEVAQHHFLLRVGSLVPLPLWLPTRNNVRLQRAVLKLDAIIYEFIRKRRESAEDKGDLLSLLLHARDEGDRTGMTDRQLRDEAMTLFLAGHETTALTLSWAWYLLATNPEAARKLQAEVDAVLGERSATASDWPRLVFTEQVIMEAMRLYPPAYVVGREALQDCVIGGYSVPRARTVLMPQWVVHRDPRWFADPDKFRPERWQDDAVKRLPKFAYFPFGGGPRQCIGNTFAMMETVLVLATIAQHYDFTVVPDHPVVPFPTFTLRPRQGIRAVLHKRDGNQVTVSEMA